MSERTITTSDGRALRVYEAGDPAGKPILLIYGTPSGGTIYERHDEDARSKGIRLVCFDRPGYGGSDRLPDRAIADVVPDVTAIADELGIGRFGVWGVSGGGPHALACAALLPDRVPAVASLASVAPYGSEGLDWTEGMGEDNIEEFGAMLEGREAHRGVRAKHRAVLASRRSSSCGRVGTSSRRPRGRRGDERPLGLLASSTRARWGSLPASRAGSRTTSPSSRHGASSSSDIRMPVLHWQGEQDHFVPPSHGAGSRQQIPGVESHLSPDDGHLTLGERRMPEVHAWLLERL